MHKEGFFLIIGFVLISLLISRVYLWCTEGNYPQMFCFTVSSLSCRLQVLQYQSQQSYQNKVVPSAAVLFVYVERAHGLPVRKHAVLFVVLTDASGGNVLLRGREGMPLRSMTSEFILLIFFVCLQLKKNGKEPKAGAEILLKSVSYKTKVETFFVLVI